MKPLTSRTIGYPGILEAFFNEFPGHMPRTNVPAVNVKETDKQYLLEIMAPGMNKEDFNLELVEDRLIISGEHRQNQEAANDKYTRKEFSFQSFKRAFSLPENAVEADAISAAYENGILRVTLPKRNNEKSSETKKILIK